MHTPTHYKTHTYTQPHITKLTYTHPHITKPTHTHTHALQNPHIHTTTHYKTHIHTPTHYKTHTYTHPHITKPTHTNCICIVSLSAGFLYFWGIVFLLLTTLIMIFKKEYSSTEPSLGVAQTYHLLWNITRLPSIRMTALILLTSKVSSAVFCRFLVSVLGEYF